IFIAIDLLRKMGCLPFCVAWFLMKRKLRAQGKGEYDREKDRSFIGKTIHRIVPARVWEGIKKLKQWRPTSKLLKPLAWLARWLLGRYLYRQVRVYNNADMEQMYEWYKGDVLAGVENDFKVTSNNSIVGAFLCWMFIFALLVKKLDQYHGNHRHEDDLTGVVRGLHNYMGEKFGERKDERILIKWEAFLQYYSVQLRTKLLMFDPNNPTAPDPEDPTMTLLQSADQIIEKTGLSQGYYHYIRSRDDGIPQYDYRISKKLIKSVEKFARERGLEGIPTIQTDMGIFYPACIFSSLLTILAGTSKYVPYHFPVSSLCAAVFAAGAGLGKLWAIAVGVALFVAVAQEFRWFVSHKRHSRILSLGLGIVFLVSALSLGLWVPVSSGSMFLVKTMIVGMLLLEAVSHIWSRAAWGIVAFFVLIPMKLGFFLFYGLITLRLLTHPWMSLHEFCGDMREMLSGISNKEPHSMFGIAVYYLMRPTCYLGRVRGHLIYWLYYLFLFSLAIFVGREFNIFFWLNNRFFAGELYKVLFGGGIIVMLAQYLAGYSFFMVFTVVLGVVSFLVAFVVLKVRILELLRLLWDKLELGHISAGLWYFVWRTDRWEVKISTWFIYIEKKGRVTIPWQESLPPFAGLGLICGYQLTEVALSSFITSLLMGILLFFAVVGFIIKKFQSMPVGGRYTLGRVPSVNPDDKVVCMYFGGQTPISRKLFLGALTKSIEKGAVTRSILSNRLDLDEYWWQQFFEDNPTGDYYPFKDNVKAKAQDAFKKGRITELQLGIIKDLYKDYLDLAKSDWDNIAEVLKPYVAYDAVKEATKDMANWFKLLKRSKFQASRIIYQKLKNRYPLRFRGSDFSFAQVVRAFSELFSAELRLEHSIVFVEDVEQLRTDHNYKDKFHWIEAAFYLRWRMGEVYKAGTNIEMATNLMARMKAASKKWYAHKVNLWISHNKFEAKVGFDDPSSVENWREGLFDMLYEAENKSASPLMDKAKAIATMAIEHRGREYLARRIHEETGITTKFIHVKTPIPTKSGGMKSALFSLPNIAYFEVVDQNSTSQDEQWASDVEDTLDAYECGHPVAVKLADRDHNRNAFNGNPQDDATHFIEQGAKSAARGINHLFGDGWASMFRVYFEPFLRAVSYADSYVMPFCGDTFVDGNIFARIWARLFGLLSCPFMMPHISEDTATLITGAQTGIALGYKFVVKVGKAFFERCRGEMHNVFEIGARFRWSQGRAQMEKDYQLQIQCAYGPLPLTERFMYALMGRLYVGSYIATLSNVVMPFAIYFDLSPFSGALLLFWLFSVLANQILTFHALWVCIRDKGFSKTIALIMGIIILNLDVTAFGIVASGHAVLGVTGIILVGVIMGLSTWLANRIRDAYLFAPSVNLEMQGQMQDHLKGSDFYFIISGSDNSPTGTQVRMFFNRKANQVVTKNVFKAKKGDSRIWVFIKNMGVRVWAWVIYHANIPLLFWFLDNKVRRFLYFVLKKTGKNYKGDVSRKSRFRNNVEALTGYYKYDDVFVPVEYLQEEFGADTWWHQFFECEDQQEVRLVSNYGEVVTTLPAADRGRLFGLNVVLSRAYANEEKVWQFSKHDNAALENKETGKWQIFRKWIENSRDPHRNVAKFDLWLCQHNSFWLGIFLTVWCIVFLMALDQLNVFFLWLSLNFITAMWLGITTCKQRLGKRCGVFETITKVIAVPLAIAQVLLILDLRYRLLKGLPVANVVFWLVMAFIVVNLWPLMRCLYNSLFMRKKADAATISDLEKVKVKLPAFLAIFAGIFLLINWRYGLVGGGNTVIVRGAAFILHRLTMTKLFLLIIGAVLLIVIYKLSKKIKNFRVIQKNAAIIRKVIKTVLVILGLALLGFSCWRWSSIANIIISLKGTQSLPLLLMPVFVGALILVGVAFLYAISMKLIRGVELFTGYNARLTQALANIVWTSIIVFFWFGIVPSVPENIITNGMYRVPYNVDRVIFYMSVIVGIILLLILLAKIEEWITEKILLWKSNITHNRYLSRFRLSLRQQQKLQELEDAEIEEDIARRELQAAEENYYQQMQDAQAQVPAAQQDAEEARFRLEWLREKFREELKRYEEENRWCERELNWLQTRGRQVEARLSQLRERQAQIRDYQEQLGNELLELEQEQALIETAARQLSLEEEKLEAELENITFSGPEADRRKMVRRKKRMNKSKRSSSASSRRRKRSKQADEIAAKLLENRNQQRIIREQLEEVKSKQRYIEQELLIMMDEADIQNLERISIELKKRKAHIEERIDLFEEEILKQRREYLQDMTWLSEVIAELTSRRDYNIADLRWEIRSQKKWWRESRQSRQGAKFEINELEKEKDMLDSQEQELGETLALLQQLMPQREKFQREKKELDDEAQAKEQELIILQHNEQEILEQQKDSKLRFGLEQWRRDLAEAGRDFTEKQSRLDELELQAKLEQQAQDRLRRKEAAHDRALAKLQRKQRKARGVLKKREERENFEKSIFEFETHFTGLSNSFFKGQWYRVRKRLREINYKLGVSWLSIVFKISVGLTFISVGILSCGRPLGIILRNLLCVLVAEEIISFVSSFIYGIYLGWENTCLKIGSGARVIKRFISSVYRKFVSAQQRARVTFKKIKDFKPKKENKRGKRPQAPKKSSSCAESSSSSSQESDDLISSMQAALAVIQKYNLITKEMVGNIIRIAKDALKLIKEDDESIGDCESVQRLLDRRALEKDYFVIREIEERIQKLLLDKAVAQRQQDMRDSSRYFKQLGKLIDKRKEGMARRIADFEHFKTIMPEIEALKHIYYYAGTVFKHTISLVDIFERLWRFNEADKEWLLNLNKDAPLRARRIVEGGLCGHGGVSEDTLTQIHKLLTNTIVGPDMFFLFVLTLLYHDAGKVSNMYNHAPESRLYFDRFLSYYGISYRKYEVFSDAISAHVSLTAWRNLKIRSPQGLIEDIRNSGEKSDSFIKILVLITIIDEVSNIGFLDEHKMRCYLDVAADENWNKFLKDLGREQKLWSKNILKYFGGIHNYVDSKRIYNSYIVEEGYENIFTKRIGNIVDYTYINRMFSSIESNRALNVIKMLGIFAGVVDALESIDMPVKRIIFMIPSEDCISILSKLDQKVIKPAVVNREMVHDLVLRKIFLYGFVMVYAKGQLIFEDTVSQWANQIIDKLSSDTEKKVDSSSARNIDRAAHLKESSSPQTGMMGIDLERLVEEVWTYIRSDITEIRNNPHTPASKGVIKLTDSLYKCSEWTFSRVINNIGKGETNPFFRLKMNYAKGKEEKRRIVLPKANRLLKIGFFSLAAHPFHWGHLLVPFMVMAELGLDVIIFQVQGKIWYKVSKSDYVSVRDRHSMVKQSIVKLWPLGRKTDLGSQPGDRRIGFEEMLIYLGMNTDCEILAYWIVGVDSQQRVELFSRQQYEVLKRYNICPNHKIGVAWKQRGPFGATFTMKQLKRIYEQSRTDVGVKKNLKLALIGGPDIDIASTYYREGGENRVYVPTSVHKYIRTKRASKKKKIVGKRKKMASPVKADVRENRVYFRVSSSSTDGRNDKLIKRIKRLLMGGIKEKAKANKLIDDDILDEPTLGEQLLEYVKPLPGKPLLRVINDGFGKNRGVKGIPKEYRNKLQNDEPLDFDSKEDFLNLSMNVFPQAVGAGLIKPVVIINIKNYNTEAVIAYGRYLRECADRYYNNNIVILLVIEHADDLKSDLAGTQNLLNMAVDVLGEQFLKERLVLTILDGGEKKEWANLIIRYGQSGVGPARRAESLVLQSINTLGALALTYPRLGYDDIFNIAIESEVALTGISVAGKKVKDLPEDRTIVFYGKIRVVVGKTELALIKQILGTGQSWRDIVDKDYMRSIIDKVDNMGLQHKGMFYLKEGRLSLFQEKVTASRLLQEVINRAIAANLEEGIVYENLWLVTYKKNKIIDFARKSKQMPVSERLINLSSGRITNLSQLEVDLFQMIGLLFMSEEIGRQTVKQWILDDERPVIGSDLKKFQELAQEYFPYEGMYAGEYGPDSEAEDIRGLLEIVAAWRKERRGGVKDTSILGPCKVEEGATVKGSLKTGIGNLVVRNGSRMLYSLVHVDNNREMVLPTGATIIDSNFNDKVQFIGEGIYLIAGLWFFPRSIYDLMPSGRWERVERLIIYPDEAITTIQVEQKQYIIRDIISLDFNRKIGEMISQNRWDRWVKNHPHIFGVKGVSDTWEAVKDKSLLELRKYPNKETFLTIRSKVRASEHLQLTIVVRSSIGLQVEILEEINNYVENNQADKVVEMYKDAGACDRVMIGQVLDSLLFGTHNARWSARWIYGEIIGLPVHAMFEIKSEAHIVVKKYKEWRESGRYIDAQKIEKIIASGLLESPFTNMYKSSKFAQREIDKYRKQRRDRGINGNSPIVAEMLFYRLVIIYNPLVLTGNTSHAPPDYLVACFLFLAISCKEVFLHPKIVRSSQFLIRSKNGKQLFPTQIDLSRVDVEGSAFPVAGGAPSLCLANIAGGAVSAKIACSSGAMEQLVREGVRQGLSVNDARTVFLSLSRKVLPSIGTGEVKDALMWRMPPLFHKDTDCNEIFFREIYAGLVRKQFALICGLSESQPLGKELDFGQDRQVIEKIYSLMIKAYKVFLAGRAEAAEISNRDFRDKINGFSLGWIKAIGDNLLPFYSLGEFLTTSCRPDGKLVGLMGIVMGEPFEFNILTTVEDVMGWVLRSGLLICSERELVDLGKELYPIMIKYKKTGKIGKPTTILSKDKDYNKFNSLVQKRLKEMWNELCLDGPLGVLRSSEMASQMSESIQDLVFKLGLYRDSSNIEEGMACFVRLIKGVGYYYHRKIINSEPSWEKKTMEDLLGKVAENWFGIWLFVSSHCGHREKPVLWIQIYRALIEAIENYKLFYGSNESENKRLKSLYLDWAERILGAIPHINIVFVSGEYPKSFLDAVKIMKKSVFGDRLPVKVSYCKLGSLSQGRMEEPSVKFKKGVLVQKEGNLFSIERDSVECAGGLWELGAADILFAWDSESYNYLMKIYPQKTIYFFSIVPLDISSGKNYGFSSREQLIEQIVLREIVPLLRKADIYSEQNDECLCRMKLWETSDLAVRIRALLYRCFPDCYPYIEENRDADHIAFEIEKIPMTPDSYHRRKIPKVKIQKLPGKPFNLILYALFLVLKYSKSKTINDEIFRILNCFPMKELAPYLDKGLSKLCPVLKHLEFSRRLKEPLELSGIKFLVENRCIESLQEEIMRQKDIRGIENYLIDLCQSKESAVRESDRAVIEKVLMMKYLEELIGFLVLRDVKDLRQETLLKRCGIDSVDVHLILGNSRILSPHKAAQEYITGRS
ncbi:MAG: hypothetical protein JSV34_02780, partial [Candidatus Omnitrophota bacterium]